MARMYISFTVPARYVDYGQLPVGVPHPMVAIATVGSTSPIRLTRKRTTVENSLQQVQNNVGCFVLDLSYFKLRPIEVGQGNVLQATERLCRAHRLLLWLNITYSVNPKEDYRGELSTTGPE
jgi:hypothetical protein